MIPWLKSVLYDPNSFTNLVRGFIFVLGSMPEIVNLGDAGTPAWYVGKGLQAFALFMKAGDANPKA